MKYMLIMNSPRDGYEQYMKWPKKILEANAAFMESFSKKLVASGELVPLDEQDRTLWDSRAVAEGVRLAGEALSMGALGEYQLQATIAAVHAEAPRAEDTDWPQIVALYRMLMRITDSPVVALNHAIAVAMVDGPHAGLTLLRALESDERLIVSHRLDAVRAHLLDRAGDHDAAIELYRRAASRTTSIPERNYLLMKAARLAD